MKNTSLYYVIFILLFFGLNCSKKEEYHINGNIKGLESEVVMLATYNGYGDEIVLDSAILDGGSFKMSVEILHPQSAFFLIDTSYMIPFFLEEGEIELKADIHKSRDYMGHAMLAPEILGGVNNSIYQDYLKSYHEITNSTEAKALDSLYRNYISILQTNDIDNLIHLEDKIDELQHSISKKCNALRFEIAMNNPDKVVSSHILLNESLGFTNEAFSLSQMKTVVQKMKPYLGFNEDFIMCNKKIETIENLSIGKIAPEFSLENEVGENIALSDYREKLVLLNFWAYWCGPCIDQFPGYKSLYKKYNDRGFEIINVSEDPDKIPWKRALIEHQLPWSQAIVEKNVAFEISETYNVELLPTNYLIDQEGIILGNNLTLEELEVQLKKLLN